MSPITTHVLDTAAGRPAAGVPVLLERQNPDGSWHELTRAVTNRDGRIPDLMAEGSLRAATYRITFDTGAYFAAQSVEGFYPTVPVVFRIVATEQHYHVPLLVSPFGYSTYRGS